MLGAAGNGFGNQSQGGGAGLGYATGQEDVYIQNLSVMFNTSVAGLAFNTNVGRVGYKISPYIYQRQDRTSYFHNSRWDNGKYYFDGGILGFNFGAAKLDVFAGVNPQNTGVNGTPGGSVLGTPLDPVVSGNINGPFAAGTAAFLFNRQLGANLNIPLTSSGHLNLAYLWLDSNADVIVAAGQNANRLAVFGGTLDFNLGKLKVEGGYSANDLQENTNNILTNNNLSYYGKLSYGSDKWGLWGDYRVVDANYLAPGDWGRLGVMRNPTNINGFQVGGHIDLSSALTLKANGEFDKGQSNTFAAGTGFGTGTKINKYSVTLGYKVSSALSFYAGYEDTKFQDMAGVAAAGTTPDYKWTTFGLGYGLSDTAKLTIQYQLSDVSHDYQVSNNGNFKGGLLTSQLSIKF